MYYYFAAALLLAAAAAVILVLLWPKKGPGDQPPRRPPAPGGDGGREEGDTGTGTEPKVTDVDFREVPRNLDSAKFEGEVRVQIDSLKKAVKGISTKLTEVEAKKVVSPDDLASLQKGLTSVRTGVDALSTKVNCIDEDFGKLFAWSKAFGPKAAEMFKDLFGRVATLEQRFPDEEDGEEDIWGKEEEADQAPTASQQEAKPENVTSSATPVVAAESATHQEPPTLPPTETSQQPKVEAEPPKNEEAQPASDRPNPPINHVPVVNCNGKVVGSAILRPREEEAAESSVDPEERTMAPYMQVGAILMELLPPGCPPVRFSELRSVLMEALAELGIRPAVSDLSRVAGQYLANHPDRFQKKPSDGSGDPLWCGVPEAAEA